MAALLALHQLSHAPRPAAGDVAGSPRLSAVFNYGYLSYHARWALRKLDATAAPRGTKRQPARSSEPPDAIAAAAPREIVAKRLTRAATCSTLRKAGAAITTQR